MKNIHPIKEKGELKKFIKGEMKSGKTRSQVYRELKPYYKKSLHSLAVMVGEFPEMKLRKKYLWHSYLMGAGMLLLSLSMILLLLVEYKTRDADSVYYSLVFPAVIPVVSVWVFQFIPFGMRVGRILAYFSIPYIVYGLSVVSPDGNVDAEVGTYASVSLVSAITVITISSILHKKIMKNYGFFGPRRLSEGEYSFPE